MEKQKVFAWPPLKHRFFLSGIRCDFKKILFLALPFLLVWDLHLFNAAEGSSAAARINVSAIVRPVIQNRITNRQNTLSISEQDLKRGYIEVPEATFIEVRSNTKYLLNFSNMNDYIKEITVKGLENEVVISSNEAFVLQPYSPNLKRQVLSYRFILSENARPGLYAWPLVIRVSPI